MGGEEWRGQLIRGFPRLGGFAEPGVVPRTSKESKPLSGEEFRQSAKARVKLPKDDGLWYGFAPRARHVGPTAAVLHNNCLSREKALLASRFPEIPFVGCYDVFGGVVPRILAKLALRTSAISNDDFFFAPRKRKAEASSSLEFRGLSGSFRLRA